VYIASTDQIYIYLALQHAIQDTASPYITGSEMTSADAAL